MKYSAYLLVILTHLIVCSAYTKSEMDNWKKMRDMVAAKKAINAAHHIKDPKYVKHDYKKASGSKDYATARDLILHNLDGKAHVKFTKSDEEKAQIKHDEGIKNYQAAKDLTIATHMIKTGRVDRDIANKNKKNVTEVLGEIGTGVDDFIYGYINGLLDANLTVELKECDTWRHNAEKGFNGAWD